MKTRVNITLDYGVYKDAKSKIKNLSAFIEKCLDNYNKGIDYRRKINADKNTYYDAVQEYANGDKTKFENIINCKWIEDADYNESIKKK